MARVGTVKKARKNYPEFNIKKGDTYYYWKFRYGSTQKSKTYPRRSQLTQSDFLGTLYDLQDDLSFDETDLQGSVENLTSEIEQLRDECEDSLSNMPDHLQEASSSGELLTERIDALDEWTNELEGVDLEIDEKLSEGGKEERVQEIIQELQDCECSL